MADLELSGFWDTSFTAGVQPPLTDEMLEHAERELGVTLPLLLVELLRVQNWIALDYRRCGPAGEPSVWWLDTERDESLELAPSFETFVRGLVPVERFD